MAINTTTLALLFLLGSTLGQSSNYVEETFDYEAPSQRPASRAGRPFSAPSAPKPTPVPILKQINRHNEDGSYTYGYEGADGSFKIETKLPTGEVMGKYGYVDDLGKVRVVEYGANKYGFQPAGEGITVAPPTLVDETTRKAQTKEGRVIVEEIEDDGQYFEEPVYVPAQRPVARPAPRVIARPSPRAPQVQHSPAPARPTFADAAPINLPAPQVKPQPLHPRSQPQQTFQPDPVPPRPVFSNAGHVQTPPRPTFANSGPAPPRPVFANAAPAPVGHQVFAAPVARPSAPVYEEPRPAPLRIPVPHQRSSIRGGILDQLEKDYALPQSSSPSLHDISFGSY